LLEEPLVLLVPLGVGGDEGAPGDDHETPLHCVVEGVLRQLPGQAPTGELLGHLGVGEHHAVAVDPVVDAPGTATVHLDDENALLGDVPDRDLRLVAHSPARVRATSTRVRTPTPVPPLTTSP